MIDALKAWLYRLSKRKSRKNLYVWLQESIELYNLSSKSLALSIGAGGDIAAELERCGIAAVSVDIDPCRKPDVVASIEDLDTFSDASVDAVFVLEVLEHVRQPQKAASEMVRVLRPGGVLIGSTPFLLGIHDSPHDYFRYTRHGLKLLFRDLHELSLRERNGYFAALSVLIVRLFVTGSDSERRIAMLLSPLLLVIVLVLESLDRVLPSADGTTGYFFVFRKPDTVDQ